METLSVILIGWNALEDLKQCLSSLEKALAKISHQIIYVDNASEDGTLDYIHRHFPPVLCLPQPRNLGISKARNAGMSLATGRYFWILDSDTLANADAIEKMLQYMEEHEDAGICACKLLDEKGIPQDSCRKFPTVSFKLKSAFRSIIHKVGFPINPKGSHSYDISGNEAMEVDYVIGACQLIRKGVPETIGGLDETIFYGPEDADFCLRAKQAGWKVVYLPSVSIIHKYKRITTRKIFNKLTYEHVKALVYYFKKHKNHGLS